MKHPLLAEIARHELDAALKKFRRARIDPPARGWIRDIREALGMTSAQLAKRLGVTQSSVAEMEKSEARGVIRLATLRKAAAAMECRLVYLVLPKASLKGILNRRRYAIAERAMGDLPRPRDMRELYAQSEALNKAMKKIDPRRVWDEEVQD